MFASVRLAVRVGLASCAVPLSAALVGCHAPAAAPAVPVPIAPASLARSVSPLSAVAQVQQTSLYKQAERACQSGRYAQAAGLLQHLSATPNLSPDALAFCRSQRALCLRHLPHSTTGAASNAPPRVSHSSLLIPHSSLSSDCGPRALAIVCQKLGVRADVPRLRVLAGTNAKGTSLAGLAQACAAVGLKAEGVQVSREALGEVELPALAWVNRNHYVALLSVAGDAQSGTATIADPNTPGEQTMERERLLRLCGGYLLLVHR